jgi:UDP-glucose 4-epimerase
VIVLDNLYSGKTENLYLENWRLSFFRGDVCDEEEIVVKAHPTVG